MKLNLGRTALVVGLFVSLMHLVWMLVVYFGLAQWYLDWILGLHLVSNPFKVLPFSFGTALTLVIFTFVVGYIAGWVFAIMWNRLVKGK